MRGNWGKIWLAALMVTVSLICAPLTVRAADTWERGGMPLFQTVAQTSLEAQMLGEKPFQTRTLPASPWAALLSGTGLQVTRMAGLPSNSPLTWKCTSRCIITGNPHR